MLLRRIETLEKKVCEMDKEMKQGFAESFSMISKIWDYLMKIMTRS